jgi:hypothetical protein
MRAMDEVEAGLANALVPVVVGTHPRVSPEYVLHFLEKVLGVYAKEVVIRRCRGECFLLNFSQRQTADIVLFAKPSADAPLVLLFQCWMHPHH